MSTSPPIPVISLASRQTLGASIQQACIETGFFYLCDHGIPQHDIERMFQRSREFFALEEEVKERCADRQRNTGFTAVKKESLDPGRNSDGDLKESFYLARLATAADESTPEAEHHQPPTQDLPDGMQSERKEISAFIELCKAVAAAVLEGFAEALNLESSYFTDSHHGAHDRLRLIHYPPAPVQEADHSGETGSVRAGSHSDYGSCTLLFQKDVGGLQVQLNGDQWVDIPPQPGCLVVNVGDAMEFWTAGLFRSTQHRVVLPRDESETASRYSMAYFSQPDESSRLTPLALPLSPRFRASFGTKAMSIDEFERRARSKGIDVDAARLSFQQRQADQDGGGETGSAAYLQGVSVTGGEHLRARLAATYR